MKIGIQRRNQLLGAGQAGKEALEEFQSLIGALAGWGNREHTDEGTHTDVTANSVTITAIRNMALRVVSGLSNLGGAIAGSSTLTPPQLTGDVDNYCPVGIADAFCLRVTTDVVGRVITGLRDSPAVALPTTGRLLLLFNAGSNAFTLENEGLGSAANYRFRLGGNFATVDPNESVLLFYDGAARRWLTLASSSGAAAGFFSEYNAGNSGVNASIDWANGAQQILTLTANTTLTLSNPSPGGIYRLILVQDATGGRTVTLPGSVSIENDVLPAAYTQANDVVLLTLVYTLLGGGSYVGYYSDVVFPAVIGADSVTNAGLANMAESTIKGRAAGAGTGDPQDLTATQATAILNVMVGDSGSGGTKGLVPAPAAGDAAAAKFLKADGTWAAPAGGTSEVVQVVYTQTGAVATGTTTIPIDDTPPQNTEGTEFQTLTITPTNAANILHIDVEFNGTLSVNTTWLIVALFQDTAADALKTAAAFFETAGGGSPIRFHYSLPAGTTSATTFKVRAGGNAASTVTFNGTAGGRLFGGTLFSSITITETVP